MTDTVTESATNRKSEMMRFIIYTGWMLTILVCLGTIGSVVWNSLIAAPIDDNLAKLAFAASGFLFGSFPALMKDLMKE